MLVGQFGLGSTSRLSAKDGAIVLRVTPVFLNTTVTRRDVAFQITADSQVGIIVQRIVGTTRFLGRRAPKLKLVGRVPLGSFKRGRRTHRVRWDHKVNGKRLRRGEYLVTVRSVTSKARVRDLGTPVRVRIR